MQRLLFRLLSMATLSMAVVAMAVPAFGLTRGHSVAPGGESGAWVEGQSTTEVGTMSTMLIDVEGERFAVSQRLGPGGQRMYDFTWLNGPSEPSYGFTIGSGAPLQIEFSQAELEEKAAGFVHTFFSSHGIGPSDFPDFVASRHRS